MEAEGGEERAAAEQGGKGKAAGEVRGSGSRLGLGLGLVAWRATCRVWWASHLSTVAGPAAPAARPAAGNSEDSDGSAGDGSVEIDEACRRSAQLR